MSLTLAQKLEMDRLVSKALGKRYGESIHQAAERIMAGSRGHPAWRVASIILEKGDPWKILARAAKAAKKIR